MNRIWKPVNVDQVDIAFGGKMEELLPSYNEIPTEFFLDNNEWVKKINNWFFNGVSEFDVEPQDGIDPKLAIRHIHCILASYAPKHEHKIAGTAYLLSLFFKEFKTIV